MGAKLPNAGFDGTLDPWVEVEGRHEWDALLLGNGMSINLWHGFNYTSLYEEARQRKLLSGKDQALFDGLGVTNFEDVLRQLAESIRIGDLLGSDRTVEQARHTSIQKALAAAVLAVHVEQGQVPLQSLEAIRRELRRHRHVFTTSYDLLVYWASGKGPEPRRYEGFCDWLWAHGINAFDESTIWLSPAASCTRLYYLHGALHLAVLSDGTTCKHKATMAAGLLDKFGAPVHGDSAARPLVVTEATAADKLRSINANDYLTFCLDKLSETDCPTVIFGHSLSPQDQHIVRALNQHADRAIAVSIRGGTPTQVTSEKHRIASLLHTRDLHFFRADSHPLGAKELRLTLGRFAWPRIGRKAVRTP